MFHEFVAVTLSFRLNAIKPYAGKKTFRHLTRHQITVYDATSVAS
jgi:hypothetical protein